METEKGRNNPPTFLLETYFRKTIQIQLRENQSRSLIAIRTKRIKLLADE